MSTLAPVARLHTDATGDGHLQIGHPRGRVYGNRHRAWLRKTAAEWARFADAVTTSSSTSRPIQNTIERGNRERGRTQAAADASDVERTPFILIIVREAEFLNAKDAPRFIDDGDVLHALA